MRVALYSRVSTRDKGQDTDNQVRLLKQYVASQPGWMIVAEFADEISGGTSVRPQFQAMFEAASRRKFDCLLFFSLDRLSREGPLTTLQHLERLTSSGIVWKSLTEQYLDSTGVFRDAIIGILSALAQQEKIRLRERVMAGLEKAKAQGRVGGRPRVICNRDEVKALNAAGRSQSQIAIEMGLNKSTVQRIIESQRVHQQG